MKFFEKTRLPPTVLGEVSIRSKSASLIWNLMKVFGQIWQIADTENRGLLTPAGFGIVLRLIGYAQAGHDVSMELALKRRSSEHVVEEEHD